MYPCIGSWSSYVWSGMEFAVPSANIRLSPAHAIPVAPIYLRSLLSSRTSVCMNVYIAAISSASQLAIIFASLPQPTAFDCPGLRKKLQERPTRLASASLEYLCLFYHLISIIMTNDQWPCVAWSCLSLFAGDLSLRRSRVTSWHRRIVKMTGCLAQTCGAYVLYVMMCYALCILYTRNTHYTRFVGKVGRGGEGWGRGGQTG